MRLLKLSGDDEFSFTKDILDENRIPRYAILSHTWQEGEEVTFDEFSNESSKSKAGYTKLRFCAQQAKRDDLEYFWVDTCCINKANAVEVQDAINSMFRWYQQASQCYVYLADVSIEKLKADNENIQYTWESAFRQSRWFTRGWTLQELLAPHTVTFFSKEGAWLGDKKTLERQIHETTGVPIQALQGAPLHEFSKEDRLSWSKARHTTRKEDKAYSLLGIFGISMVPNYGEGEKNAFRRLHEEITESLGIKVLPLDNDQRRILLDSLRLDQIDARQATIKKAHAKTCKWLLKRPEYIDWLNTTNLGEHGFLWIKGKPGTGKSTLMKFALANARKLKDRTIISFFFNARGEDMEKSTIGTYRSLLLQLLERLPALQCVFDSLSLSSLSIRPDHQWSIESLKSLLEQAIQNLGQSSVICFIDALDECEEDQVRDMVQFFERISELCVSAGIRFQICFSSRHYPHITIQKGLSLVLEGQEGHSQDITNYLESELNIGKSKIAQQIRSEVQEKASGVFMWVVLVVGILNKEYDRGRIHALRRRLQEIPSNLHTPCRDTLKRDSHNRDELVPLGVLDWSENSAPHPSIGKAMVPGFSDSGYASAPPDVWRERKSQETLTDQLESNIHQYGGVEESTSHDDENNFSFDDTKSIYSVATSATMLTKDQYIAELVDDLVENVLTAQASDCLVLDQLYATLPGLLKAFARNIGHLGESRESREVMVFVSKHKELIVAKLKEHFEAHNARSQEPNLSGSEKVAQWNPDPISGGERVEDLPLQEPDPLERFVGVSDFDEQALNDEEILNLPPYRDYIVGSPAYGLLLSRIKRDVTMTMANPNVMRSISDQILLGLSHSHDARSLSRSQGPLICNVRFILNWALSDFIQNQGYPERPDEAFGKVITLTGTGTNAQAITTEQYIQQTWPLTGIGVFEALKDILRQDPGGNTRCKQHKLKNGAIVQAASTNTAVYLNTIGTIDAVAEIGEQLAWLGAAVRSSPGVWGLSYCSPFIRKLLVRSHTNGSTTATCDIDFTVERADDEETAATNGRCWYALFHDPVIVMGFPIPTRREEGTGIEIPLNIMAGLVGTRRLHTFAGHIFLKRFNLILILTKRLTDVVLWHLIFNDSGDHVSYTDPRIWATVDPSAQNPGLYSVQSARHVVGWCSKVSSLTGSPSANYSIGWSQLQGPHRGFAFEKVTISGGQFISAGASFVIGKKDNPVQIRARDDYLSQLRWISKKFVVLYDVGDRRAWMVDGVSALLHLVRASLKHNREDEFNDLFLFDPKELEEAGADRLGKAAAISVLTDDRNKNIKLHEEPGDSYHEETTSEEGIVERVKKRKVSFYRFKDRVDHIYHILEQIIVHQSHIESQDGVGFKVKSSPRRQLEGFDFMDIASEEDPLWPRMTTLASTGVGWVDFARAMHAITLFGRGFGDLFKPSCDSHTCTAWTEVPKGHDYLTVSVLDLKEILKKRGCTLSNPWRLVDEIHWHNPEKLFEPCKTSKKSTTQKCCERIQVLLPSSFPSLWARSYRAPPRLEDAGAVIFGHNRRFPLRWGDSGAPEESEPSAPTDNASMSPSDSGIGSSIDSKVPSASLTQLSTAGSGSQGERQRESGSWLFRSDHRKKRKIDGTASNEGKK